MQRDGDKGLMSVLMLAGMAKMAGQRIEFFSQELKPIKQMRKCALVGCDIQCVKDYCSADHCRKHKELHRG